MANRSWPIMMPKILNKEERDKEILRSLQPPKRKNAPGRKELFVSGLTHASMRSKMFLFKLFSPIAEVRSIRLPGNERPFAFLELYDNAKLGHVVFAAQKSPMFQQLGVQVKYSCQENDELTLEQMKAKVNELRALDKENGSAEVEEGDWGNSNEEGEDPVGNADEEGEDPEGRADEEGEDPEGNGDKEAEDPEGTADEEAAGGEPACPVEKTPVETQVVRFGKLVIGIPDLDGDPLICCVCSKDGILTCMVCGEVSCPHCFTTDPTHGGRCMPDTDKIRKIRESLKRDSSA